MTDPALEFLIISRPPDYYGGVYIEAQHDNRIVYRIEIMQWMPTWFVRFRVRLLRRRTLRTLKHRARRFEDIVDYASECLSDYEPAP